jgi:hypothetical protein
MRMQIDEGVYIDFYNLHADAGYDSTPSKPLWIRGMTRAYSSALVPILATFVQGEQASSK